jgi:probable phosphoglycerate mutase
MISITDMELTPRGVAQARRAKQHINKNFDFVFTSPLLRARQTAEIMAGQTKITVCDDLAEMNIGVLEGLTWKEAAQNFPEINTGRMLSAISIPGGESFNCVQGRCRAFVANRLSGLPADACVLIMTHGITKRVLVNSLLNRLPKYVDHLDWCDNTSYSIIEISPENARLLHLNQRQHLEEHDLGAENFHIWSRISDKDYTQLGG